MGSLGILVDYHFYSFDSVLPRPKLPTSFLCVPFFSAFLKSYTDTSG